MTEKNEIRDKIVYELTYLGYDISLVGTRYLIEIIYIIVTKKLLDEISLKNDIYPILAIKYNKNINNIKCSINYATEVMYNRSDICKKKKYFNFIENIKPHPKLVIYAVLNKISR